ncbi:MAG: class I SAM-dependent methyltransferase [Lachnospiraceae bacterium]|nr:class I SAM-dependent methyltransferase [Lachnospiraceae bacterium]
MKYTERNGNIINDWAAEDSLNWTKPVDHERFLQAKAGDYAFTLTPVKRVPMSWIPSVRDLAVLGLAAGGGQQMAVLSAAGAKCTLLDISDAQLAADREVAEREGYDITIIKGDMTERFPFPDASFDLIVNPVSNQYIRDVYPVFEECARVLKPGGILLCGLPTANYFALDDDTRRVMQSLPYDPLSDPELYEEAMAGNFTLQFSHTLEEQIGGQLKAGLTLTGIYEDTCGEGPLHEMNIPMFIATRSVKKE